MLAYLPAFTHIYGPSVGQDSIHGASGISNHCSNQVPLRGLKVNSLDVELVKFAREEFRRKYGMKCEEMP